MSSNQESSESASGAASSLSAKPQPAQSAAGVVSEKRWPDPPWLVVVNRHRPRSLSLYHLFRHRMAWTEQNAYWRRRTKMLQLQELARLALALNQPLGPFLEEMVREIGVPPLGERAPLRLSPEQQTGPRCGRCRQLGHTKRTCRVSDQALLEMETAGLLPKKRRNYRSELKRLRAERAEA